MPACTALVIWLYCAIVQESSIWYIQVSLFQRGIYLLNYGYTIDGSASTHKAVQCFENLRVTQIVFLNITAAIS